MPLERLITRRIALADVNDAFSDLQQGNGIRSVIINDA